MAKPSTIDAHAHLLGAKPDADVAKLAGVSVSAVYQYRRARGIGVVTRSTTKAAPTKAKPAAKRQAEAKEATRRDGRGPVSALDAHRAVLGVLADGEVAARVGITRAAVAKYRTRHGIPSAGAAPKGTTRATPVAQPAPARTAASPALASTLAARPRASKLDAFVGVIGVLPDAEVARRAGVTREAVRQFKVKRGITSKVSSSDSPRAAAAPQPAPAPTLPARMNVMPAGVMCWRITLVDGSVTHLAASTVLDAAHKAHGALGARAVGIALLGSMYP